MSRTYFFYLILILTALISSYLTLNLQSQLKIDQYNPYESLNDDYTEESKRQIDQQIEDQKTSNEIPDNIKDIINQVQQQEQQQESNDSHDEQQEHDKFDLKISDSQPSSVDLL